MKLSPAEFDGVRTAIHQLSGLVLAEDKQYLVTSRLIPLLQRQGLTSFQDLIIRLQDPRNDRLRSEVIDAMSTNETSFNRDGHPFEALRQQILPEVARRTFQPSLSVGRKIRIWSAAASTGQEPYSIGMAIYQMFDTLRLPGPPLTADHFSILASDVSQHALAIARKGHYPTWELDRGLTSEQRSRFFTPTGNHWTITDEIRRLVEFQRLNFVEPVPNLGSFDIILCRNLLIYFNEATRTKICDRFFQLLNPQGYLLIGSAESLFGIPHAFQIESIGKTQVYRKP